MGETDGENTRKRDYRLVPFAAAAWIFAFAGSSQSSFLRGSATAILAVGAISCVFYVMVGTQTKSPVSRCDRHLPAAFTALAALLAAGISFLIASVALGQHMADPATQLAQKEEPMRALVAITQDPQIRTSQWGASSLWVQARTVAVEEGSQWHSSDVQVVVEANADTQINRGDQVQVFGSVRTGFRSEPPSIGILSPRTIRVISQAPGWQMAANNVKERLVASTEGLPPHARGLIPGMAVGDDRLLPPELKEAMLTSSLTHLTAVSGTHIAVVLAFFALLIPGIKWIRPAAMAAFLILLIAVVGPQPSVLRASGSAAIAGWGLILHRSSQPQAALSAVIIGSVLISPWLSRSFGFALSSLATWGILFSGRTWIEMLRDRYKATERGAPTRMSRRAFQALILPISDAAAISIAAQLWVLPVTLLMNPWLPTFGVVANVAVIPAVAPVTILGLLAAAFSKWGTVAHFLCTLAVPFTSWMNFVALTCASLPGARLSWVPGSAGVVSAALLVALGVGTTIFYNAYSSD